MSFPVEVYRGTQHTEHTSQLPHLANTIMDRVRKWMPPQISQLVLRKEFEYLASLIIQLFQEVMNLGTHPIYIHLIK